MRGDPPKLELSSGGQVPCSTDFHCWVSVLGTHLCQCTSWHCCGALCLASAKKKIFWRLFQPICSFHDGWFTRAPAHTTLRVQEFLTKNGTTPAPYPPDSPDLVPSHFFFVPPDEKSPHRETFCQREISGTKNGRSTKRYQNRWVQKLFWAVEKCLDRCIASKESTLKVTEVYICNNKYIIFISKFWLLGGLILYGICLTFQEMIN